MIFRDSEHLIRLILANLKNGTCFVECINVESFDNTIFSRGGNIAEIKLKLDFDLLDENHAYFNYAETTDGNNIIINFGDKIFVSQIGEEELKAKFEEISKSVWESLKNGK